MRLAVGRFKWVYVRAVSDGLHWYSSLSQGTKAGSDTEATDGIVDGHAYTVAITINTR